MENNQVNIERNPTRSVKIGSIEIGNLMYDAGADVVRIAVDNKKEAAALAEIRKQTKANLSVDLQENYRMAEIVAPHVDKLRYNPGHLYHDPAKKEKYSDDDSITPMLESALEHCEYLDSIGFQRFCVSLKDSDPSKVIEVNQRFAERRPDVPLHLGVTEAGIPPEGVIKTRIAFEQLIGKGIGDTVRVSLTVPNHRKGEEIEAGRSIIDDIYAGRVRSVVNFDTKALNIISCPSCSRVENEAFVDLAVKVKEMTQYAKDHAITIAVMGCRVNGPGETEAQNRLGLFRTMKSYRN